VDDCGQTCDYGELQTFVNALKFCACEKKRIVGSKKHFCVNLINV